MLTTDAGLVTVTASAIPPTSSVSGGSDTISPTVTTMPVRDTGRKLASSARSSY